MFRFKDKNIYGGVALYTFDVINKEEEILGEAGIVVGDGRHDAALILKAELKLTEAYTIIEDFRELLDHDLIKIDEPHERIILSEIVYR